MFVGRAEKPESKMILGGRFAYTQNLPRAFQTTVLKGQSVCLWRAFWSVVCLRVCVVSSLPLPLCEHREREREAPKQGSAQVEVMEGTGSDKMYREARREGGRVRQRVTGPDKYPLTQTTTTRDKRSEQWQQEKQVGKAGSTVTAAAGQTGRSTRGLVWMEVYKVKRASLARKK